MMWRDCIQEAKARRATPDISLAKALIEMSARRLAVMTKVPLTGESSSIVFVENYEALREIVEAIAAKLGYKIYSHECLTSFLKEILREEVTATRFDRLRRLRNGVDYYGETVPKAETEKAIQDISAMITGLKEKYLKL